MFTTIWAKYLPVLRIVLKKSLVSEQMFSLNVPDFERAGLKRKAGYKFLIKLKDGKPKNVIVDSPIASSLSTTLLGDESLKQLLLENEFHISLDSKFQLTIKNIPSHEMKEAEVEVLSN